MTTPDNHTYHEIVNQPQAWAQALEVVQEKTAEINNLWNGNSINRVLFTGCGSTYYLSLAAATLFQKITGKGGRAVPGGELFLYPEANYESGSSTLLIAISRSGTTTETITVTKRFKQANQGPIVAITNNGDSPLAALGDITIAIPAGQEKSVAQTRSFASMYIASTAFTMITSNKKKLLSQMNKLPSIGEYLIQKYEKLSRGIGENLELDRFYFLGSGPRYGLACETNLKMKEMTLTHSEPFHFFEFRHGPMSMVTETSAVIGLRSSTNTKHEQKVLDEMMALGGQILSLGESEADIIFESELPEDIRDVLYLPPLQLMAYYRAIAKGFDPDNPRNLSAVIQLDVE